MSTKRREGGESKKKGSKLNPKNWFKSTASSSVLKSKESVVHEGEESIGSKSTTSQEKIALIEVAEAEEFIMRMLRILDDKKYEIPEMTEAYSKN